MNRSDLETIIANHSESPKPESNLVCMLAREMLARMEEMTFAEYQQAVTRTMNRELVFSQALANYALGIAGETGEVCEPIKKYVFHGRALNISELSKEIADVLWYCSALATTLGMDIGDLAKGNIEKLKERYPDGFVQGGGVR